MEDFLMFPFVHKDTYLFPVAQPVDQVTFVGTLLAASNTHKVIHV